LKGDLGAAEKTPAACRSRKIDGIPMTGPAESAQSRLIFETVSGRGATLTFKKMREKGVRGGCQQNRKSFYERNGGGSAWEKYFQQGPKTYGLINGKLKVQNREGTIATGNRKVANRGKMAEGKLSQRWPR